MVDEEVIETPNLAIIGRVLCRLSYPSVVQNLRIELSRCPNLGLSRVYKAQPHSNAVLHGPEAENRTPHPAL